MTQGKYKAMMLEVTANKGMGANVSQSVETVAQDKVTAAEVRPKAVLQAVDIGKTCKKRMSEHQHKLPPPISPTKSQSMIKR